MSAGCQRTAGTRPASRRWIPAILLPLLLATPTHRGRAQTDTDLEERSRVRLRAVRLRITPTESAEPGACLGLDLDRLKVTLRGDRLDPDRLIELEREPRPTIHALVIDTSRSMVGKLESVHRAAGDYIQGLNPDHERGMIVTFDDSVFLQQPPTADRALLHDALESLQLGGNTSMYDAVYETVGAVAAFSERPVILVLTDGSDSTSFYERHEVHERLDGQPDVPTTIFTIGFGVPPIARGYVGPKPFLQRIAQRTNGRYFDVSTGGSLDGVYRRIRELLDNEATLVFEDPDPDAEDDTVRVSSSDPRCEVSAFRPPRPAPDEPPVRIVEGADPSLPVRLRFPPGSEHERLYHEWKHVIGEPVCSPENSPFDGSDDRAGGSPWFVDLLFRRIEGCGLDITMESGILHSAHRLTRTEFNGWLGMQVRPFEFEVPPVERLPGDLVQAVDQLADAALAIADHEPATDARKRPAARHARPYEDLPVVVHGRTLLELRSRFGETLYQYPSYRTWIHARLAAEAERGLQRLVERYRRYAPEAKDELLRQLARESEAGRRLLARAERPELNDLTHLLAGWLGDVSAHTLFVTWERRALNDWLKQDSEAAAATFFERWTELRRLFFLPSYARVLAPLVPVYDAAQDRIGFWRVTLPRPSLLLMRAKGLERHPDFNDIPLDLLPDLPLFYWAVTRGTSPTDPGLATVLANGGTIDALEYELLDKAWKQGPEKAFRTTRITAHVRFEPESGREDQAWVAEVTLNGNSRQPEFVSLELQPARATAALSTQRASSRLFLVDPSDDGR